MDTTYWGRNFGLMLFKDAVSGRNLLKKYVKHETNAAYVQGIAELKEMGFIINAIVCDGRKGLPQSFSDIPVQMCQFHQSAIIRRYLTKKPKLIAAKELLSVVDLMKQTDKESFDGALNQWLEKWQIFLNERTLNPATGKTFYTHKRLRSAYRSLKTNLPWLFTWYDNIELKIPNTTNAIDGHFADLKNKLRNHNGLTKQRKMKFINEFLKA
jgi:transposase-like protein